MSEEKRMLGNYEVVNSIYIGDKEVVFGVDKSDKYPFLVATATTIIRLVCRGQQKALVVTIIWKLWGFSFSEYSPR